MIEIGKPLRVGAAFLGFLGSWRLGRVGWRLKRWLDTSKDSLEAQGESLHIL